MTAAYDEIADWYEERFGGGEDPLGLHAALGELLGTGSGPCLEIGCGTGHNAGTVADLGWTPVGVDISARMLGHARGRLPVARGDAALVPVRSGAVSAVVTVMAHTDMPDFFAVLRQIERVLAPGGVYAHVGVHPCFVGGFADHSDPAAVVVRSGYRETHWTKESWTDQGLRDKVGAVHVPLAGLLNGVVAVGMGLERFVEGGEPVPSMLGILARKPG